MELRLKRVYEPQASTDGLRVLVDRLWPRGLSKKEAAVDLWLKEIAPSTALRKWFGHDPARWTEFQRRYREELADRQAEIVTLRERADSGTVTLLFGARDEVHNQAVALKAILETEPAG